MPGARLLVSLTRTVSASITRRYVLYCIQVVEDDTINGQPEATDH